MTDRAVSTAINYVMSLAIATVLVTGLLIAGGDFVESRQEEVLRTELEVIGQQVVADVNRADRLATAGRGTTQVWLNQTFPERISGTRYWVELESGSPPSVVLVSTDPEVSVTIEMKSTLSVVDSRTDGGDVAVVYDETADALEVDDG